MALSQRVKDKVRERIENIRKIPHRLTLRVIQSQIVGEVEVRFADPYDVPVAFPLWVGLESAKAEIAEWASKHGTSFRIEGEKLIVPGGINISALTELVDIVQIAEDTRNLSRIDQD
jgi:hypothetical protein